MLAASVNQSGTEFWSPTGPPADTPRISCMAGVQAWLLSARSGHAGRYTKRVRPVRASTRLRWSGEVRP
jgi:hypothetical protein